MRDVCIDDFSIFKAQMSTLKETSFDDTNHVYMLQSEEPAVNFDAVKESYLRHLYTETNGITSCDALVQLDGSLAIIEFKNGKLTKERQNIRLKICETLLVFCDITKTNISYTREKVNFILVYNYEKNPSSHIARNAVGDHFLGKAGERRIRFGFEKVKGIYFHDVVTCTTEEFSKLYLN